MIEKYLLSHLLVMIDEFDSLHQGSNNSELKKIAYTNYNEADIAIKLGSHIGLLAKYNFQNHSNDILITEKDYIIKVSYLRNFKSSSGTYTNKTPWAEAFDNNFKWLCDEINSGKKGNRAFVLGWFNFDGFNNVMQLGKTKGSSPKLDKDRLRYFPFLIEDNLNPTSQEISYTYYNAYKELNVPALGVMNNPINCIFVGKESDLFHFALYY